MNSMGYKICKKRLKDYLKWTIIGIRFKDNNNDYLKLVDASLPDFKLGIGLDVIHRANKRLVFEVSRDVNHQ
jgi:hypothetical protein